MEEKILEMLAEICEDDVVKENTEVELFETGLLDSIAFAELLFGIEDKFGVVIAPSEVSRADIDTPQKIIDLIKLRVS
ncbi:MAG: D-alanine--poly(phosphoribitol) ligase subunit 2 [Lachnospiraceae bacterium]|nr:D-alanine--poly(phosphoribitol) ligase subunit 2 [Lachnospiraceae bacterium]